MIRWLTVANTVLILTTAAGTLGMLESMRRVAVRANIIQDELLAEFKRANVAPSWVSASAVHHNCYTDKTAVTCTFTNLSETPVQTCSQGQISQKEAPGVKLESVIICTGKLSPNETRVVTAPWQGGFADDICYKENTYGKSLDWSRCNFATKPIDVPAMRQQALAAR